MSHPAMWMFCAAVHTDDREMTPTYNKSESCLKEQSVTNWDVSCCAFNIKWNSRLRNKGQHVTLKGKLDGFFFFLFFWLWDSNCAKVFDPSRLISPQFLSIKPFNRWSLTKSKSPNHILRACCRCVLFKKAHFSTDVPQLCILSYCLLYCFSCSLRKVQFSWARHLLTGGRSTSVPVASLRGSCYC